ncbi:hypothetical protein FRC10_003402 [Ceratobasidium sp. 414]|nr:hypothetical protein FRC10_003402 [Ceratobasidium sp. 414]
MFFAKSLIVVAALASHVLGHAVVQPVLGVAGAAKRSDTQRPSTAKPCGKTALSTIDSSSAIAMTGTTFTANATNFNANKDGSLRFTAQFDVTGAGTSFRAANITKNGPLAPPKVGQTAQLSVSLPAGTKCTGGASKNLCLVSFKSASGFGNCVVVKQGGAAAGAGAGAGTASASASAKPATKSKAPRSRRHPRDFVAPSQEREYVKRAMLNPTE